MHVKTDSESTSIDASAAASRPVYYVQSPSNHDVEKMSYGSGCSPMGSPAHPQFYHCSPIHHSRESSNSRFSGSLKSHRTANGYKTLQSGGRRRRSLSGDDEDNEDNDTYGHDRGRSLRLYVCLILSFVLLFAVFSLILWGASKSYKPKIVAKGIVFENFNVQAGIDRSGVPTDMLSLNSTVRILYRNPATFFAVHVSSTPLELHYFQLVLASGQMRKFSEPRKSQRSIVTVVQGHQVPLYGGVPVLLTQKEHPEKVSLPLNLTLVIRSRAYILGRLVKTNFRTRIRCLVKLRGNKLGQHMNLNESCIVQ